MANSSAERAMPTESDPFAMLRTIYRQDPRSGRWKGWDKTECGIHVPTSSPIPGIDEELPPGYEPVF